MPSINVTLPDTEAIEHLSLTQVSKINLLKLAWSLVVEQFLSSDVFQFQVTNRQDSELMLPGHVEVCSKVWNSAPTNATLIADFLGENPDIALENGNGVESDSEEVVISEPRIWSKLHINLEKARSSNLDARPNGTEDAVSKEV